MDPLDAPPPPPPDVARRNAAMVSIDITDKLTQASSGECADCRGRLSAPSCPAPAYDPPFRAASMR
ncbi:hypothetical protein IMZ48_32425 [Candidatus Bathyarchaeota archaeon]|nr:hypothetical protein [Candidatus Bathyarchaeota archaeon]